MSEPSREHAEAARGIVARCAIITLSDSRTEQTDSSGAAIREALVNEGHHVTVQKILPDDPARLSAMLDELLARADLDVILTTGGTGISPRDQTIGVIEARLESTLPGFGELFRMLSWQQIGSAAMLSRAVAGICGGKAVFAMPGSTKAVQLAMGSLILPQIKHVLGELRKA